MTEKIFNVITGKYHAVEQKPEHSKLFQRLTTNQQISEKEKYEQEKKRLNERLENMKYEQKRQAIQKANLELTIAKGRHILKNGVPIIEQSKQNLGILKKLFK